MELFPVRSVAPLVRQPKCTQIGSRRCYVIMWLWRVYSSGLCVSQDLAPIRLQKRTPQTRVLPEVRG
jgi:hypothetical protein